MESHSPPSCGRSEKTKDRRNTRCSSEGERVEEGDKVSGEAHRSEWQG